MKSVVILGGGLAGPALALFLDKHDIPSVIYECRDEDWRQGGHIALAPNALRVADHIGIYNKLRSQGCNYELLTLMNSSGGYLATILNGSEKEYSYSALRVPRAVVRKTLLDEVKARGIPIHYNKKGVAIQEEAGGVTVTFEDGDTVSSEFVVGADGIHSIVRRTMNPSSGPKYSGLLAIIGMVHKDKLATDDIDLELPCMLYGKGGAFTIMPASYDGRELGFFATVEYPEQSVEGWSELEKNKEMLRSILHDLTDEGVWPSLVKELIATVAPDTLDIWPFQFLPNVDHYISEKGRLISVGDAAHAIPPSAGQGAAAGLEDAETLAYAFSKFLQPGVEHSPKYYLELWQEHRKQRIAKIFEVTQAVGSMRKKRNHAQQLLQEWLIWAKYGLKGVGAGLEWIYLYNSESVLRHIAQH